ncbi:hypothetical protein [Roseibium sp.]|uniref:hypothetical protein n=1 Tax=Roseibium sp. TaxID=1936156 RepID=UPI003D095D0F
MATLALSNRDNDTRPILSALRQFIRGCFGFSADASPGDRRARRDCLRDMMTSGPDAFSSEADVEFLMHMFPNGR